MKRVLVSVLASSAFLASCATNTPVCRAPLAHEMAAFSAVISHNENALRDALAPGALQTAFTNRDPELRTYVWGSQGVTRGTVVGILSQPPLCILDDPANPATNASRQVLVYPQESFDRELSRASTQSTSAPLPYGVFMRDYMSCRFEQTSRGWKLADMCGYGGRTSSVVGF